MAFATDKKEEKKKKKSQPKAGAAAPEQEAAKAKKAKKPKKKKESVEDDIPSEEEEEEQVPTDPISPFHLYWKHKALFYFMVLQKECDIPSIGHNFMIRILLDRESEAERQKPRVPQMQQTSRSSRPQKTSSRRAADTPSGRPHNQHNPKQGAAKRGGSNRDSSRGAR